MISGKFQHLSLASDISRSNQRTLKTYVIWQSTPFSDTRNSSFCLNRIRCNEKHTQNQTASQIRRHPSFKKTTTKITRDWPSSQKLDTKTKAKLLSPILDQTSKEKQIKNTPPHQTMACAVGKWKLPRSRKQWTFFKIKDRHLGDQGRMKGNPEKGGHGLKARDFDLLAESRVRARDTLLIQCTAAHAPFLPILKFCTFDTTFSRIFPWIQTLEETRGLSVHQTRT